MPGAARVELRRPLLALAAFAIPLGVYLSGFHYVGSGDTLPAELLPITLLRDGDADFRELVSPSTPLPYCFRVMGGRVVSTYPLLPGLLNTPVFAVADVAGVDLIERRERLSLISAATISALSVMFLFLALVQLGTPRAASFFFAMIFAFATCVWSVASRGLWQHGPSLLLLTAALWQLARKTPASLAWSGLLLGMAMVNRPTNVLIALPLAAVVFTKHRRAFPVFLGLAAIPIALRAIYAWAYWGSPLSLAQADPFPQVANFGGNPLAGLAGLLVSPSRGLLVFSPIFLFLAPGLRSAWRRREVEPLPLALAAGALGLLLVTAKWTIWWGGHTFGYRLLIEALPALVVLLALAWEERIRKRPVLAAAFLACVSWSVLVHGLGARFQPSGFNQRMDADPAALWSLRDSEIAMTARKALARP